MSKLTSSYVVAVSGGVDSVVLLDALTQNRLNELTSDPKHSISRNQIIVAHFDHGIRQNSRGDARFVGELAASYQLQFETERVELGAGASEATAREARYTFLRKVCNKYNGRLITAHHQDDLLETMLINLIRGTGWRGLVSLNSSDQVLRPLLSTPKFELLDYANKYQLKWREDSTNSDEAYLRNYVRRQILPLMSKTDPSYRQQLLEINRLLLENKQEIAKELQKLLPNSSPPLSLPRYHLIMWPTIVALEVIYNCLTQLDSDWHPSRLQLHRALQFIKTGQPGKCLIISKHLTIGLQKQTAEFKKA